MPRRPFLISLAALILGGIGFLATPGRAAADNASASAFVQSLADQALASLRDSSMPLGAREALFRRLLRQGFDIPFIGRFAAGRYWSSASPAQQAEYLDLFGEFILRAYSQRLGGYQGEKFTIVGARAAGSQDVVVQSRIDRPSGPPLEADWRVRATAGQEKIIDVVVEGVSMGVTQRAEFGSVIASSGMEGLLAVLRARVGKLPVAATSRQGG